MKTGTIPCICGMGGGEHKSFCSAREERNALHCQARGCDGCTICKPALKETTIHPLDDLNWTKDSPEDWAWKILSPLGLTQTAFPDRHQEFDRVVRILRTVEREALERAARVCDAHAEEARRHADTALNRPGGGWCPSETSYVNRMEGESDAGTQLAVEIRKLSLNGDTIHGG